MLQRRKPNPIEPWAAAIDRLTGTRMTVRRVKLAGYIFRKFDREAGCFWYGLNKIANALCMNERTARRGLEFFTDIGFLISRARNRGPGLSNTWELALPAALT
jgi:hypothetical protein